MQNQNQIPKKGDIIINPTSQRPVRVGGRTWLGLVKKGLVEGRYTDPKELAKIEEPDMIQKQIEEANKTLPRGQQAVRGRGKYKGKIVSRNKRPDTEDVSRYTAQMASRVVNENIESLADCDDLEAELERLILQEMAGTVKKVGRPKKVVGRPKQQKYILEEEETEIFDDEAEFYEGDSEDDYE
jgi:hypothetical protein